MAETPAKAEVVALALRSPPWIIRFWHSMTGHVIDRTLVGHTVAVRR
jgi:hypothetical protein